MRLFLTSASVLALAGSPAVAAAETGTYAAHRPGLQVQLVVNGNQIVSSRIWARARCSDGHWGGVGIGLHGPSQWIGITSSGSFELKRNGYGLRVHLAGRVHGEVITGTFAQWERREQQGITCGTGAPGHRALKFAARLAPRP